jgi:hypothetical protein
MAAEFELLPSQRVSLYELLTRFNFNPLDFEIVETKHREAGDGEVVQMKKTGFYFAIFKNPDQYSHDRFIVAVSPGAQEMSEAHASWDWGSVLGSFQIFLDVLRRELSVADPWENAKEYAQKLQDVPKTGAGNDSFTEKEKNDIQKKLEDIKHLLLDHVKDDKKKQRYLRDQFRMLHDAITKFGKKDYLMLVYTAVIGMATTIGVPPGVGMQIWQMLNGLLSHIPRLIAIRHSKRHECSQT